MPHAYTEDQLVEQPAIGLFAELGWQTVSALEETFGAPSPGLAAHAEPLTRPSATLSRPTGEGQVGEGASLDHWSAIENGAHYRRDVSLGEDASQVSGRTRPFVMATLRNLVLGLFELQKHRGKTPARTFPSWRRKLTDPQKIQLITRTQ